MPAASRVFHLLLLALAGLPPAALADTPAAETGVVVMHGKGGSPAKHVLALAQALEARGHPVANLEMPWSQARNYGASVADAEQQVDEALAALRARGAKRLFIAGHSQGGVFATHLGGRLALDGIIAIAPGADVSNPAFADKLGGAVTLARQMVAEGRGDEQGSFQDYEASRGTTPVNTTARIYLDWFDPQGAMNHGRASRALNPKTPLLYIAPTGDYPGLRKVKDLMFGSLPRHRLTRMIQPNTTHLEAPAATVEEIARWMDEVGRAAP